MLIISVQAGMQFSSYLKSHAVVTSAPPPNAQPWTSATLIKGSLYIEGKMYVNISNFNINLQTLLKTWDAIETKLLNYVYNK